MTKLIKKTKTNTTYLSESAVCEYIALDKQINELVEKRDLIKKQLLSDMEKYAIKKIENKFITLCYVNEMEQKRLDSARLKLENPSIYDMFTKMIKISPNVKITIKNI